MNLPWLHSALIADIGTFVSTAFGSFMFTGWKCSPESIGAVAQFVVFRHPQDHEGFYVNLPGFQSGRYHKGDKFDIGEERSELGRMSKQQIQALEIQGLEKLLHISSPQMNVARNTEDRMITEALDRVKIGTFARMGIPIRGVIHVGANNGYEVEWYLKMGVEHVLCFEPLPSACVQFVEKYGGDPRVKLICCALGDYTTILPLTTPEGDGQGSTLLEAKRPDIAFGSYRLLPPSHVVVLSLNNVLHRLLDVDPNNYNCLVVDTQGYELQVLHGAMDFLHRFDCLNIECSREPIYEGEAPAQTVVDFLVTRGFKAITPIEEHNDILFVKDTWQTS